LCISRVSGEGLLAVSFPGIAAHGAPMSMEAMLVLLGIGDIVDVEGARESLHAAPKRLAQRRRSPHRKCAATQGGPVLAGIALQEMLELTVVEIVVRGEIAEIE